MKSRYLLLLFACLFLCVNTASARWITWDEYRELVARYVQSWSDAMRTGIVKLNNQPQMVGVTPVNGALLINSTHYKFPGRELGLIVQSYYNSKIWRYNKYGLLDVDMGCGGLGLGRHLHFGKISCDSASADFILPDGLHKYFKNTSYMSIPPWYNKSYVSTDGNFWIYHTHHLFGEEDENWIKTNDGTIFYFDGPNGKVEKIQEPNGNYISVAHRPSGIDSIVDTKGSVVNFHYSYNEYAGDTLLDSLSIKGESAQKIKFHYTIPENTFSDPYGNEDEIWAPLLSSIIFANLDSIIYKYNEYGELDTIINCQGGKTAYTYANYPYIVPQGSKAWLPPPSATTDSARIIRSRMIKKVKLIDPVTNSVDSIMYARSDTTTKLRSNPDTVFITDGLSNDQLYFYECSGGNYSRGRIDTSVSGQFGWTWKNGNLDKQIFYDGNSVSGVQLRELRFYDKRITSDSISVADSITISTGNKKSKTHYMYYDSHGNIAITHKFGDVSISDDDRWIHQTYSFGDKTFWLKTEADGWPNVYSYTSFFSLSAVDSLRITRYWGYYETQNVEDSTVLYDYSSSPEYSGGETLDLTYKDYSWCRVSGWAYEHGTNDMIWVCVDWYIEDELSCPDFSKAFAYKQHYTDKGIYNLLKSQTITANSSATDTLSRFCNFYDDTSYITKTYATSPVQWETSYSDSIVRGDLTRVEQWKGGSNYTKSEFRYDNVGNIVQQITHPSASKAETTFIYYDPPSNPDTFQYVYPWRTVVHPASNDSLCTRTEYDFHTGVVLRSVDESNSDSTRYEYDNMYRLTKRYFPNKDTALHRLTYKDSESPEAVIDSLRLKGSGTWAVRKTFFDGFGRLTQTKAFDFDNSKTIVQNVFYNGNGVGDSVCNAYEISGTSYSYSSPSWSQLTFYQYDGLNRIAKVKHPDAESIMVKYYANSDTVFDEKGDKTIYKYNALGAIDTVFDALNNKTCYTYDRLGRLTKIINAENDSTMYYYDNLSRLIAMNCPDAKSSYSLSGDSVDVLYEYDNIGNLTCKIDANDTVDYYYDNINRLTKVKHSDGDSIGLIYDTYFWITGEPNNSKGRLTKMVTTGTDSMVCYYNDRGTLARKDIWITGLSGKKFLKYKYNDANQCTLMTLYPGVYNTYYHYDKLGRLEEIPNLVDEFRYTASNQILRIEYANDIIDTISYDNRLRPTRIKAYKSLSTYLDLGYYYQTNSNIDSIIDNKTAAFKQVYTYDSLNRLIKVKLPSAFPFADSQWFSYDKIGNRAAKNGTDYSYYSNTNRLYTDHQNHSYDYDDNGNIIRHRTGQSTIDSLIYDWNNRLIRYKKGNDTLAFAYNASGLRVKKHYHEEDEGGDGGNKGTLFLDSSDDLGVKSTGIDSTYNKGRDIEKVYVKNTANYLTFTIVNKHLFSTANKLKLFITLDLDTITNSGRISLPEDRLTKVPTKAAWEYCIYVSDNDYGLYKKDGTKVSKPFGMAVQKVTGDTGSVQIKISKQLLNNVPAIRYTIATFDPNSSNGDSLWQGGSSACDVYPGTNATFGGEINGYGEISLLGILSVNDYTIYYVYGGINPIVEYSPNGSIFARYIYAGGLHIAKIAGADTHFYHCDALGSARVMTNESASIQWQARYWPFGEMTKWGFGDNTHGFTGKEWDSEMGLNYFCQRYYDPEIGRFMTLDPLAGYVERPQSQNRYAYCMNNPLKYIDPLGLLPPDFWTTIAKTPHTDVLGYGELETTTTPLENNIYSPFYLEQILNGEGGRSLEADMGILDPEPNIYAQQLDRFLAGLGFIMDDQAIQNWTQSSEGFASPDALTYGDINWKPLEVPAGCAITYSFNIEPFIINSGNLWSLLKGESDPLSRGSTNTIIGGSLDLYLSLSRAIPKPVSIEIGAGWNRFLGAGLAWDESNFALSIHIGFGFPPTGVYTSTMWGEKP